MMPARRKLIVIFVALAVMIVGAITLHNRNNSANAAQSSSGRGGGRRGGGMMPGGPGAATPVQVQTVGLGNLSKTIGLTGNISALQDVQLSSKISGRVLSAGPLEGETVHAGQVIVQLDTTDLEANVRQDQAQILSAQAQVAQAQQNYQIQVTQAKQNVLNAQAAVAAANQNYLKLVRGNRPQQILEAKSQLLSAKATTANALTTLNEDKTLYAEGAIAKNVLDTAQTTYNVDLQQQKLQEQAYSLELSGYQNEDISAAKEQVREAQANLKNQIANERTVLVRKADIQTAEALVSQANQKMIFDQQQVSYGMVNSPIDGIIAARMTQPGQVASAGTALVRIVDVRTVYFQPTISDTDVSQIKPGAPVSVKVDALAGKVFSGRVAAVYPAANATNRLFTIRVVVDNPGSDLRPGMFARGDATTQTLRNVPIVPNFALIPVSDPSGFAANTSSNELISGGTAMPPMQVAVLQPDNSVQLRPVTVGLANMQSAAITGGLRGGEQIVVIGQQTLKNGSKVIVENQNGAPAGARTAGGHRRGQQPAPVQ